MEDEIVVSRQMLKAIGADTRIDILKSLVQRQKTQSELATELKLSAPTISEHLDQLHQSDLIEINPDYADKKWKYYRLTKTARNILERKKANVILVLANISAILTCILLGFYFFLPSILGSVYPTPSANAAYAPSADHETTQIYSATKSLQSTSADYVGLIIVAMVVITLVLFAITYMKRKKL